MIVDGVSVGSILDGGGALGLCVLITFMIITGRLVPKRHHDEVRQEAVLLREQNTELIRQNSILISQVGPTVVRTLNALHDVLPGTLDEDETP